MAMMRMCSICNKVLPYGKKCECELKREKNRHKLYSKYSRSKESQDFYETKQWRSLRKYLNECYMNMDIYLYYTEGKVVEADVVHHIVPLKEDKSRGLDVFNLIPLSHDTHNKIEKIYKEGGRGKKEMIEKLEGIIKEAVNKFNVLY